MIIETPAYRALEQLCAGRFESAQEILAAVFTPAPMADENFPFLQIHNMIQNGMLKEAEDALRRMVFDL